MTIPGKILIQRLEHKGVPPAKVYGLIKDVAVMISAGQPANVDTINQHLKKIGWQGVRLDEKTLEMMIDGFKDVGRETLTSEDERIDPVGQQQLIDKIYKERGIDFRGYSMTSLSRRFSRRLKACGVTTYAEYLPLLDKNKGEYERLINSIFVTVTRFFRNNAAIKALIPPLRMIMERKDDHPLTIWSAGCATGQEPYTMAITAAHEMSASKQRSIRIVATDIDDTALEIARNAKYSADEIKDVPEPLFQNYFHKKDTGFAINDTIRSMVTFHHHNLISDVPFEKMDIILCRNIMIYFNLALQMRVIEKLTNGLNPKGYLLLGRYEMLIKQARRQFTCVDFDARLYRKK